MRGERSREREGERERGVQILNRIVTISYISKSIFHCLTTVFVAANVADEAEMKPQLDVDRGHRTEDCGDCAVERAVESRNNNDKQFPVILVQTHKRIAERQVEGERRRSIQSDGYMCGYIICDGHLKQSHPFKRLLLNIN